MSGGKVLPKQIGTLVSRGLPATLQRPEPPSVVPEAPPVVPVSIVPSSGRFPGQFLFFQSPSLIVSIFLYEPNMGPAFFIFVENTSFFKRITPPLMTILSYCFFRGGGCNRLFHGEIYFWFLRQKWGELGLRILFFKMNNNLQLVSIQCNCRFLLLFFCSSFLLLSRSQMFSI